VYAFKRQYQASLIYGLPDKKMLESADSVYLFKGDVEKEKRLKREKALP
tara:strand:+ start:14835 stop:14981 length:147 start_codon:yes stop_codon:yes gene_type:complete